MGTWPPREHLGWATSPDRPLISRWRAVMLSLPQQSADVLWSLNLLPGSDPAALDHPQPWGSRREHLHVTSADPAAFCMRPHAPAPSLK